MSVDFDLYGGHIEFDDDLKKIYDIKCGFERENQYIINHSKDFFENRKYAKELTNYIIKELDDYAKSLIIELSHYGIYDITVEDLLSPEMVEIFIQDEFKIYENKEYALMINNQDFIDKEIDKIRRDAEKRKQKSNYIFMSNNKNDGLFQAATIMALAMHQENKIEKQIAKREIALTKEMENIENNNLNQYYKEVFIPNIKYGITNVLDNMFCHYCVELSKYNKISIGYFEQLNIEKCSELLKNIDLVDNKEKLILEVLPLNPFNIDIYYYAYKYNIFNDQMMNIVRYFDMTNKIINYIIEKDGLYCYSEKEGIINYCNENNNFFTFVAKLKNDSIEYCRKSFTNEICTFIIGRIKKSWSILFYNDEEFVEYVRKSSDNEDFTKTLYDKLILPLNFSSKEINYLVKNCRQDDFYKRISNICKKSISNWDEFFVYTKQTFSDKLKIYFHWCENEKYKKHQLKVENERKLEEKNKKNLKKLKIVFLTAFIIVIVFVFFKNIVFPRLQPCDQEILSFFEEEYGTNFDEYDESETLSRNKEIKKFETYSIKDKTLKKYYKDFIKGCDLQKETEEIDLTNDANWNKGVTYKMNALANLSAKDKIDLDEDNIELIISFSIDSQVYNSYSNIHKLKIDKNNQEYSYLVLDLSNKTGYDIEEANFSLYINDNIINQTVENWKTGKLKKITFDIGREVDGVSNKKHEYSIYLNAVTIE